MATTLTAGFRLVIECILIYGIIIVFANGDTHAVPDKLDANIRDQIETIANKTAEDIFLRLNKKMTTLQENIVQDIVLNKIRGAISDVNKETTILTNDLEAEINRLISSKEEQILNKTKTEMGKLSHDCQTEYSNFKELINSKVDNESQTIMDAITRDIQSIKIDLERDLNDISLNPPAAVYPQGAIAFTALLTTNFDRSRDSYVLFDRILTNLGRGYDAVSGIFTAPTNGSYVFSASFLVNGGYVNVQLLKNNEEKVRGYGAKGVVEGSGFVYSILELIKDDQVGLKLIQGWSTGHLRGDMYSSFSGFLVGT